MPTNNMKKIVILAIVQLISIIVYCQNTTIKGTVMDSSSNLFLVGSNIVVKDNNQKIITITSTTKKGSFEIVVANTAATLTINFIQYQEKVIVLNTQDSIINCGTIYLKIKPTSLQEVIVLGKKPPINFKIDRQVYAANQFTNAASGTAVDVMKNLPAIAVNAQGDIALRGSNSFLVLINGKPTLGEPSFVLSQLPSSSIESVEIITTPSAAADADGKAGIINIVTKANVQDGFLIQANAMGGTPPFSNFDNVRKPQRFATDILVGYKQNKFNVDVGLNYLRNDIAGFREGDVFTIINNVKTSFPSNGERSFKRYNYGGRLNIAYQPNKNNSLTAGFYMGKKFQSRIADLQYNNTKTNATTNAVLSNFNYFNANEQQKEGVFTLANVEYNTIFKNKSSLVLTALFEKANLKGITYNNNLKNRNSTDTLQYTINPYTNPLNAYRLKADYKQPIGNGMVQMGYQFRYDEQDGNFLYNTKILGTNNFIADPQFSSRVQVSNYIHAAYVQYNGITKKLHYGTGLRLEQSNRTLNFSKNNQTITQALTNLFPSIQLRYKAWDKSNLKFGYSRRIKRTNNYELNPFPEREHSETLEQGDPELLPELIGTFETGIEHTFKKGTFFATAYYQIVNNPIQRVNKIFNDTILNRAFTNAGKSTQFGIETNITYQVNKWYNLVFGGNIYKYEIKGNIFNNAIAIENSSWVYSINSSQTFTLTKNWTMQLSINYLSERATAQGKDSRFLTPHFTVKKTTNNKRWSYQLQWLNIDAGLKQSNRQRITTFGTNFYTTTNYIYEPDQLQFSIGFNLTKKNRKITLPVSEMGEKEF